MKWICHNLDKEQEFENFDYQNVAFSADSIPICPLCKSSPYESDFGGFHRQINEIEEGE